MASPFSKGKYALSISDRDGQAYPYLEMVKEWTGALVHIYTDGSVNINPGGTEMGQGLHTKIKQVAADVLGLAEMKVNITATHTSTVPNASATAASSGTDLNGMAVKNACEKLLNRLSAAFLEKFP